MLSQLFSFFTLICQWHISLFLYELSLHSHDKYNMVMHEEREEKHVTILEKSIPQSGTSKCKGQPGVWLFGR